MYHQYFNIHIVTRTMSYMPPLRTRTPTGSAQRQWPFYLSTYGMVRPIYLNSAFNTLNQLKQQGKRDCHNRRL